MINYSSIGFYYFTFLSSLVAALWSQSAQKKYLILGLNLIFHALFFYFFKVHFASLISALAFNWILLQAGEWAKFERKTVATVLIALNLIAFIVIKYSFARIELGGVNSGLFSFIGISFFTFRALSLFIDYRRGVIEQLDFIHYCNYLTFFPTFLSGPLDRYEDFRKEVESNHHPDSVETIDATFRFVSGAFKKVVLADLLHDLSIDSISLESLGHFSGWQILISLYVYTIVLYLDFSGYSDMAIGLSRLLGIKVPENFNKPYLSKNIQDFWNRWHMSFMQWLRDYIYYPFQHFLLKTVKLKSYLLSSIMATAVIFFLTGAWHGDKRQYLFYGLYHAVCFGLYLIWRDFIGDKKRKEFKKKYIESMLFTMFSRVLTIHYFVFSLLFFTGRYEVLFK